MTTTILQRRRAVLIAAGATLLPRAVPAQQQPKTHRVDISAFLFAPPSISVRVGATIVFANKDLVPHTATAKDASWDTGEIRGKSEKAHRIEKVGRFAYVCACHPAMQGMVEVKA